MHHANGCEEKEKTEMSQEPTPPQLELTPNQLSILIPVYNERYLVGQLLHEVLSAALPEGMKRELIVVDDGSTDGTREFLREFTRQHPEIIYREHEKNQGKTDAIRTAIDLASGEFCIFQDADLEYSPHDYKTLLAPLLSGKADVVYGSRFIPREQRKVLFFWHSVGNQLLTMLSNLVTDLNLTDMETCYKAFRTDLLKSIPIRSKRFGLEPEITIKVAKRKLRLYEVPINYHGRTYEEGKKITWKDGVHTLGVLLKYTFVSDLYREHAGGDVLDTMGQAKRFNGWMAELIRPYVKHRVMEVGAGIGTMTPYFLPRARYVAAEYDHLHLRRLRNFAKSRSNIEVTWIDAQKEECFAPYKGELDTILCLNVLEHIPNETATLSNFYNTLVPGGNAIILVPQGKWLYGSLDRKVEHVKRYTREELEQAMQKAGFQVISMFDFNKPGVLGWYVNGKLLQREEMPRFQLRLYDNLVGFWRKLDQRLPWHGLSLIAVGQKPIN